MSAARFAGVFGTYAPWPWTWLIVASIVARLVPVITATVVWFGWMGRHDRAFAEQESRLNSGERSQWFET